MRNKQIYSVSKIKSHWTWSSYSTFSPLLRTEDISKRTTQKLPKKAVLILLLSFKYLSAHQDMTPQFVLLANFSAMVLWPIPLLWPFQVTSTDTSLIPWLESSLLFLLQIPHDSPRIKKPFSTKMDQILPIIFNSWYLTAQKFILLFCPLLPTGCKYFTCTQTLPYSCQSSGSPGSWERTGWGPGQHIAFT